MHYALQRIYDEHSRDYPTITLFTLTFEKNKAKFEFLIEIERSDRRISSSIQLHMKSSEYWYYFNNIKTEYYLKRTNNFAMKHKIRKIMYETSRVKY